MILNAAIALLCLNWFNLSVTWYWTSFESRQLHCQIIQNLFRNSLSWDEWINDSSSYKWLKWMNQLMTLQDMNTTRCIKPKNFGETINCSLQYFSDACETGYGISAYIRLINAEGVLHCSLLLRKPWFFFYLGRRRVSL